MRDTLVGVPVREAIVQRQTKQAGTVGERYHHEPEEQTRAHTAKREDAPRRVALHADGAGM
jgi:hypothetical protein